MKSFQRCSPLFVFLVFLLVLALPAAAAGPNLTGTWVSDPAASSETKELKAPVEGAAPAPPAPPSSEVPVMRVGHKEPRLTIELLAGDGAVISTTEMTTDGAENLNQRAGGTWLHRSASTWDGAVLRTTWKLERGGQVMISGSDERQLRDPETLVVTTTTEDSRSRSKSVVVYRKRADPVQKPS